MTAAAHAYLPTSLPIAVLAALLLLATVPGSVAIARLRSRRVARALAWALAIGATVAVERLCASQPPGFRMLAIIGVALWALKAAVLVEGRAAGQEVSGTRLLGFIVAWPGMQPRPFAESQRIPQRVSQRASLPGARDLLVLGVRRLLLGAALVLLARLVWLATGSRVAATLPLLSGLSLMLHFGIFNLIAGAWRYAGVGCYALFRAPLRARSLTEFWGRRWNLAFSELTALAVYRPLTARVGTRPALLASFVFSGLLHEMAISLPVRAGFGLPLLYFALHGGLMLVEQTLARRGYGLRGWPGRVWTLAWLVLPLPILFHPPFLRGVVWPLIGIGG